VIPVIKRHEVQVLLSAGHSHRKVAKLAEHGFKPTRLLLLFQAGTLGLLQRLEFPVRDCRRGTYAAGDACSGLQ
jgi:hypothetical protein